MGKTNSSKKSDHREQVVKGPLRSGDRTRQWAAVIVGVASLTVAVFGARIVFLTSTESRRVAAINRKLEVDQAVFQAWDLLGGRPGSLEVAPLKRDKGSLELARRQIEKALTLDPTNVPALLSKAAYFRISGAPEKSLEVLETISALVPQESVVSQYRAIALSDQGKYDEAIVYFRQALALDSSNAVNHFNLGTTLFRVGKFSEASINLKRAIELDPAMVPAQVDLAALLREQGNFRKAVEVARIAAPMASGNIVALNDLAVVLRDSGAPEEALQLLEKAVELDPSYPPSYFNRGTTFRAMGNLESAVADLRQCLKRDPRLFRAYINLAGLLREQGREAEAQEVVAMAHRSGINFELPKRQHEGGKGAEHRAAPDGGRRQ
jgi:tetratricopeptide (TPR) repeat protein